MCTIIAGLLAVLL